MIESENESEWINIRHLSIILGAQKSALNLFFFIDGPF